MHRAVILILLATIACSCSAQPIPSDALELAVDLSQWNWPPPLDGKNPQTGQPIAKEVTIRNLGSYIKPEALDIEGDVMLQDLCTYGYAIETPVDMIDTNAHFPMRIDKHDAARWTEFCTKMNYPRIEGGLWGDGS